MAPLDLLRKKLHILKRDFQDIPAENELEEKKRECQFMLLCLQIECEEFRNALNIAFALCARKTVTETIGDQKVEKLRTVFKWEEWKADQISAIASKELIGIAHYEKLIKKYSIQQLNNQPTTNQ